MEKRSIRLLWMGLLILFVAESTVFAAEFNRLIGRWQRPDGGYLIEIRNVAPDGRIVANYFNPQRINVSTAQASLAKGYIKLDIELRDIGYPGSRYTLVYDPKSDRLIGLYYHAVSGQNFDVVFVRQR